MSLSKQNKILIGAVATISVGIISLLLWNKQKQAPAETKEEEEEKEIKCQKLTFISVGNLKNILKTQLKSECLVIDVRDMDHGGGNIANSINICDRTFYDKIPEMIQKYNNKSTVVIYCMYGARRSIKCSELYCKAICELINNYNQETKLSHYSMYPIKNEDEVAMNSWVDSSVVQKQIDIDFLNDTIIENLSNQKIVVSKGGYFKFFNDSIDDAKDEDIISDFDESAYEQLELQGLFDTQMWYHKKEYFAKAKHEELKDTKKQ